MPHLKALLMLNSGKMIKVNVLIFKENQQQRFIKIVQLWCVQKIERIKIFILFKKHFGRFSTLKL